MGWTGCSLRLPNASALQWLYRFLAFHPFSANDLQKGQQAHGRYGSKGDIAARSVYVGFTPECGHQTRQIECPLSAISDIARFV
jgi:hypothetical protein